jgi:hypothetical protein
MLRMLLWTLGLTLLFEVLTIGLRFGAGLESTRDTEPYISALTRGVRIHHSYIGGAILLAAAIPGGRHGARWRDVCWILGLSLVLSDLIHHFAVLWPLTGSPEFDLVYPR